MIIGETGMAGSHPGIAARMRASVFSVVGKSLTEVGELRLKQQQ